MLKPPRRPHPAWPAIVFWIYIATLCALYFLLSKQALLFAFPIAFLLSLGLLFLSGEFGLYPHEGKHELGSWIAVTAAGIVLMLLIKGTLRTSTGWFPYSPLWLVMVPTGLYALVLIARGKVRFY